MTESTDLPSNLAGMIDHTILAPDARKEDVLRLCREAREHGFASVCVNPVWAELVADELEGHDPVPCVVVGFPLGATTTDAKVFEAATALADGAREIDMVIDIAAALEGDEEALVADIRAVADAVHDRQGLLKVIIEACLLDDDQKVLACRAAVAAGAEFVKTSTGFSTGGATVADVTLMRKTVGPDIGVKASGGIRSHEDALSMIAAGATRIGASKGIEIVRDAR